MLRDVLDVAINQALRTLSGNNESEGCDVLREGDVLIGLRFLPVENLLNGNRDSSRYMHRTGISGTNWSSFLQSR